MERNNNRAAAALAAILLLTGSTALAQDHSGHAPAKAGPQAPEAAKPEPSAQEEPSDRSITISPDKRQLIGVRTAKAVYRSLDRRIRTVGKVDVDETKLAFVNTKVAGWVRKLFVDYTGQDVKKGQPLLSIYSPDLVSAQEEYLQALQAVRKSSAGAFAEIAESQQSLLASSRQRLLFWDISEEQIAELEQGGKPQAEVTLHAPLDGVVLEKMVLEGAYIMPGMNLYKIVDLSVVWVIADIYEYEVPLVRLGQRASVRLAAAPRQNASAVVSYVYPTLDPMTRTVKVRLAMENPDLLLKPEMFANVEIAVSPGSRLVVPTEAVLDSGTRQLVYVETEPGTYQMRVVKVGVRGEKFVEIRSGVKAGETVVTSGNFLIDSETQFQKGP